LKRAKSTAKSLAASEDAPDLEDPRNISFSAHLLFCSKNIERIGDHATNIAETVVYLVTGNSMPLERPHGHRESESDIDAAGRGA
jgi:phosphate transport system protein